MIVNTKDDFVDEILLMKNENKDIEQTTFRTVSGQSLEIEKAEFENRNYDMSPRWSNQKSIMIGTCPNCIHFDVCRDIDHMRENINVLKKVFDSDELINNNTLSINAKCNNFMSKSMTREF